MDIPSYLLGKRAGGGKGSLKYVVVDELPTVGEDNTIYLVPKSTSGTNNYYDEYMYINNTWELIGDTEVDLSSKQDVMQFTTLPIANTSNVGKIYQYVGTTNANYTNGYFYICVSDGQDPATYSWEQINVQDGASYTAGTNMEITNAGVINNTIPFINNSYGFGIGNNLTSDPAGVNSIAIGNSARAINNCMAIGTNSYAPTGSLVIGQFATGTKNSIVIGSNAQNTKENQVMFGSSGYPMNEMAIYTSNGAKKMATENYVDPTIVTDNNATYTIASLEGNQVYKLGEKTSITISAITTFDKETVIYFDSGSTSTTISLPSAITNLGDVPTMTTASGVDTGTCEASKSYIIAILNNVAVWRYY